MFTVKDEQRKHLMAARSIIGGTMDPVVKATSPRAIYGPDAREKMREENKQQVNLNNILGFTTPKKLNKNTLLIFNSKFEKVLQMFYTK